MALEVFSRKMTEVLNLPVALQLHPVAVKSRLKQQAPVNTARRNLMMERSKSGVIWGRLCWGRLRGDTLPLQAKVCFSATVLLQPTPALSWVCYQL